MTKNIFAIDLGNKWVKMKSERGEYVYPAAYFEASQITRNALQQVILGNDFYQLDDKQSFIWGEHLEEYHSPEKLIETYSKTDRFNLKKVIRLIEFALARLAMDYPEAEKNALKVHLVMGLTSRNDLEAEKLTKLLVKKHSCKVNGVEIRVDLTKAEQLDLMPQYMGTIFDKAYDENLSEQTEYKNGRIAIMDIGGAEIAASLVNHLEAAPWMDERFEGVQKLLNAISTRTHLTKIPVLEQLLIAGKNQKTYVYRPNQNVKDAKDITAIVSNLTENYTRFTLASFLTQVFPDVENFDRLILSGGGSELLDKEALKDEIGTTYFEHLEFLENAQLSAVRGFYKAGKLHWNIEQQPESELQKEEKTEPKNELQDEKLKALIANVQKLNDNIDSTFEEI